MSVVIGETPKQQPRDSALTAVDDVELAASFPLSLSLWIYFDEAPGENDTQTVLWYGETASNHIRLEATKNATSGIDLTAVLAASAGTVSAVAGQVPVGEWIMATVIVEEVGGASHSVTLYIDASEEDSQTGSVGTTSPADYDTFLLGAARGGSNFGRFRAEHVAVWEPDSGAPLSPENIEELYEERWAPFQYPGEPAPLGRVPGIAYWMLVGHWAAGIEAANDQVGENAGLLFNRANPPFQTAKPPLQMLDTAKPVLWSAKTPVMRYLVSQDLSPGPLVHPPIPPVSRLQPHFYVFNTTGPLGTFKYGPLEIPVYTHPNFIPKGISNASGANGITPLASALTEYHPQSDVALLAKRVADFMEFTGMKRGIGTVGDGLYEGWVILLGIGLGDMHRVETSPGVFESRLRGYRGPEIVTPDPLSPFRSSPNHVPLEMHPLDRVEPLEDRESNRPWHTWFNAHGKRLVKDYMDGFWTALKRELDERDLCYPRTLWWDAEDWARASHAVRADEVAPGVEEPHGTFTLQIGDTTRYSNEPLMGSAPLTTLEDIWEHTGPPEEYEDDKTIGSAENEAFYRWYLGWSVAITQQAMWDAMMDKAKELFPQAVWSNYDRFTADSPQFPYAGGNARELFNTPPAAQAFIHGDFSSPKLYTGNLEAMVTSNNRLMPELGVTYLQVLRNWHKSRIDACINAFSAKPLVPHFETGMGAFVTTDTSYEIFAYAWKRGVEHFIPFVFENPPGGGTATDDERKQAHDNMYEVCFRLLNYVHWMPQENHARAARVSRRGW